MPADPASPRSTRSALPMALLRAREAVMARFRPLLDAHGINEQQWRGVRGLGRTGSPRGSGPGARGQNLAPSLTRMIRSLDERGLIRRGRDEADGRRVILTITAPGQQLIEAVTPAANAIYAGIDAEFGPERMAALIALLDELSDLPEG